MTSYILNLIVLSLVDHMVQVFQTSAKSGHETWISKTYKYIRFEVIQNTRITWEGFLYVNYISLCINLNIKSYCK